MGENNLKKAENGTLEYFTLTIPLGSTVSNAFSLEAYTLVGLKLPAAMTSTTLGLQNSIDGITFFDVYNTDGNKMEWTIAAGYGYSLLPADTAGFFNLKLKVGSSEAAARDIIIICRGV